MIWFAILPGCRAFGSPSALRAFASSVLFESWLAFSGSSLSRHGGCFRFNAVRLESLCPAQGVDCVTGEARSCAPPS